MPLFVDKEGRTYYSITCLNPVTGNYKSPIHFNGVPGDPPVERGPLLHVPEAAFGRMLLWSTLLTCINILLIAASAIGWWSGVPGSHFAGVATLFVTALFQFLVVPSLGRRVPFDRPVRYWGRQPFEPLLLELTGRVGVILAALTTILDGEQPMALVPILVIGLMLLLPVWQIVRRVIAADRNGDLMIP